MSIARRSTHARAGCAACGPRACPAAWRSLEYANSPVTFGIPSARWTLSPTRPTSRAVPELSNSLLLGIRRSGRRPAGPRRGSSRSRCSGRGCRTAPRGSRRRSGAGLRSSRSTVATIRPGVQKPHWTAPASTNASCTGCSRPFSAKPSTVTTSWPSAWAASTRHAQTSVPSRRTEHEPHSPCSQAFFEPGRPSRSRSAKSRLSPSQTSASRCSPLTVSATFMRGSAPARGR